MKHAFFQLMLLSFLLPLQLSAQKAQKEKVRLFFLGGQSNMEGLGYNKDLPKKLKQIDDVYIFNGNDVADGAENGGLGIWEVLKAGHGYGFNSDGKENKLSERFGLELTLAEALKEKYPNEKIAFIKYAKGGSSIDTLAFEYGTWDPAFQESTNQYDHFLATVNNAFRNTDIDGDGVEEELIPTGIFWMQGESDAVKEEVALRYHSNLTMLMGRIRAVFRDNDLPIVMGKISDSWNKPSGKVWKYGDMVQYAQEKFCIEDPNAVIVRHTRYYKYSDPFHYNSEGYIDLGKRFAEAMLSLELKPIQ
ncbi:sialate O-acetylesterase [Sediminitomix flava]|uniref:Sialate O-acetylesterase domain-containing protein n=1 Tax=Sediminitomix flava TaxID=379075 RepID=A0A315Z7Y8_SEDFL|nr:sialate O-acetylesterase [Sediminitomix flava]PWJ41072.1 hypothetical protein BC781_104347 [Sediminitomix flava]